MSWDKTYTHTVLIAADQFAAAVFFNRPDLTISTMCWMVMEGKDATLKLSKMQRAFLAWLGPQLNKYWPNHCAEARDGDIKRAKNTLTSLGENVYGSISH